MFFLLPKKKNDRGLLLMPAVKPQIFQEILDPSELCLPLPLGTGNKDILFPLPLMAKTLLGLVMVRFDNGLEFGSVI